MKQSKYLILVIGPFDSGKTFTMNLLHDWLKKTTFKMKKTSPQTGKLLLQKWDR